MNLKECKIVQELLPLYAEDLVTDETSEYLREHLAQCPSCAQDWEDFKSPLPDPACLEETFQKDLGSKVFMRLRQTLTMAVVLVLIGGAGLAYASYTAGKHLGTIDPAYRFAQELNLFTEIKQTKTIEGLEVTVDKGLFDSTRSVLFLTFSKPVKDIPEVDLLDNNGNEYLRHGAKGWQNKDFMFEFEPVDLGVQELSLTLALGNNEQARTEFTFPVDIAKTFNYTKIIYPNLEKELSNLRISMDKAILGVSETEFKVYFDWPVDGSVAGLGIGRGTAYFPTSVRKIAEDEPLPPGMIALPGGLVSNYASSVGVNYRMGDGPFSRPALYDLTGRQEIEVRSGEYRTTQFPCQVEAMLKFAPVKQETEQLEVLLPPVYLYKTVADSPQLSLDFRGKNEIQLGKVMPFSQGELIIEKAWKEDNRLYLSYQIDSQDNPEIYLPHFELVNGEGSKQGQLDFETGTPQVINFYLFNEETQEFYLNFDSLGELLPREKFTLDIQD